MDPFLCLSRGKPPPEDVLDMFKWFFPKYLAKNAKLNVDSLLTKDLLLCSWSVPS